eukprot:COSAG06_NODE_23532_length_689_cov_0.627119_1_plen_134_part_01
MRVRAIAYATLLQGRAATAPLRPAAALWRRTLVHAAPRQQKAAPTTTASSRLPESMTPQEQADKAMAEKMGTQAVAMQGLASSGLAGESGVGEALAHVALEDAAKGNEPGVKFREMPGGGTGFAPGKRTRRVAD